MSSNSTYIPPSQQIDVVQDGDVAHNLTVGVFPGFQRQAQDLSNFRIMFSIFLRLAFYNQVIFGWGYVTFVCLLLLASLFAFCHLTAWHKLI